MLKPGGRFAVSDVVVRGEVPAAIRKSMELWVGCVAGALGDYEYVAKLATAGFESIDIEPTRVYSVDDARAFLAGEGLDVDALAAEVDGHVHQRVHPRHEAGRRGVLRPELLQLSARVCRAHDVSPRRASAPRCCSPPSSAPASWASGSPAETSRSRCSRTRSRRARRSSR